MKILKNDQKNNLLEVLPEHADDLWALSQVIDPGDEVSGKTVRKIKLEGERKSDIIKKTVFLKISVEQTELVSGELRVLGKILEGPEDVARGSYHTLTIEPGHSVTIVKHWLSYQLQRIKEATEAKPPSILICAFDREEAVIARMTNAGHEILAKLKGEVANKRVETKTKNFFAELITHLQQYVLRFNVERVILASPAFWKDELLKELKDHSLRKKTILATVSSADEQGIIEALKRPETQEALRQERSAKELKLVEEVLTGIAKGSAVAYGLAEVTAAANSGAIATLLVSDGLITRTRADGTFSAVETILRTVDNASGTVVIVSSSHDGGKKLDGLGGIAAILRYRLV